MSTAQPQEQQFEILDEKDMPNLLNNIIEKSNRQLMELQQTINQEVVDAALEVMEMMGIDRTEGWLMDLDNRRFVKVRPSETGEVSEIQVTDVATSVDDSDED